MGFFRNFSGRVIFDHLEKTAGQAVNAWLREALGDGCVTDNLIGKHHELITQFGGKYSVISAHVEFQGEGLDSRYNYVTCFRDPVDRAISWIYFVLENHGDQEIIELRNGVRTFFQTEGDQGGEFVFANALTDHLCFVHRFSSADPGERLEHALSVIDEYALWGLYECLPEFIGDFAAFLEVPAPPQLASVNKTLRRPKVSDLSPKLRARIEELNALDIAFYERLQARYDTARQRWRRPAVAVSKWQPLPEKMRRRFCAPDFALLSITREGGSVVNQNAVMVFALEFSLAQAAETLNCGLHIHDGQGSLAFGTNSTLTGITIGPLTAGTHIVRHTLVAALPEGKYDVGFTFIGKRGGADYELARLDKMDTFHIELDRRIPCDGYVSLPVAIGHQQLDRNVACLPADGRGRLVFISPSFHVVVGEERMQPITLYNESANDWRSFHLNPLHLSYRWLNAAGEVVEFDSVRTPLPFGRLGTSKHVQMEMAVKSPEQPGRYVLQALPVQEYHAWFDAMGFTPGEVAVEVVALNTVRRFKADDFRIKNQVGQCTSVARISDGREGFLSYGPYVPLPEVSCRICWRGRFDPRGGEIKVDVVADAGTMLLAKHSLSQACTEIALTVDVPTTLMDVEFRIWVSAEADVKLTEIEIEPQLAAGGGDPLETGPDCDATAGQRGVADGADSDVSPSSKLTKPRGSSWLKFWS